MNPDSPGEKGDCTAIGDSHTMSAMLANTTGGIPALRVRFTVRAPRALECPDACGLFLYRSLDLEIVDSTY